MFGSSHPHADYGAGVWSCEFAELCILQKAVVTATADSQSCCEHASDFREDLIDVLAGLGARLKEELHALFLAVLLRLLCRHLALGGPIFLRPDLRQIIKGRERGREREL